jgi:predicted Rdx family selenoprotein
MGTMTGYKFEFCVDCYVDKALDYVREVLLENAHSEDVEIVLKPGKAGSFNVSKNGETVSPESIKKDKTGNKDGSCCSSCC